MAVIALAAYVCFKIETAFQRENHKRYLTWNKKQRTARIKCELDELLKAHTQGLIENAEYERKCDELIDDLAHHISIQP